MTRTEAKKTIARLDAMDRGNWTAEDRKARIEAGTFLMNAAKSTLSPERRAAHKARKAWFARNGY